MTRDGVALIPLQSAIRNPQSSNCVSRHAGLNLALSTFDGVEHARRLLLVGRDGGRVLALDLREHRVRVTRVGLVPVEALEVALEPPVLEDLAAARVNLVAELARVFEEHAFEQRVRDGRRAQPLPDLAL